MQRLFFISDTHFGHKKIMDFEARPFSSIEEMDEAIILRWNDVVGDDDCVMVVGDFSCYDLDKNKEILSKLKGKKILIKGNHDTENEEFYRECGFASVYSYPIIVDSFFMVSHEPLYLNKNMPYANIYGHVHANCSYKDVSEQSFCVCVERINYTPILFDDIKNRMSNVNSLFD